MTASGVNPRAPEAGHLAVGREGSVSLDPLPHPAKWKTKRSTLAPILKDLLPPDGRKVDSGGAEARAGRGMLTRRLLVPPAQRSIPLVLIAQVGEPGLSPGPIPPSFSSPSSAQQNRAEANGEFLISARASEPFTPRLVSTFF